jgi:hypothetical protein
MDTEQLTIAVYAGDNTTFTDEAVQHLIGQRFPLTTRDPGNPESIPIGMCTVVAATLKDGGAWAALSWWWISK